MPPPAEVPNPELPPGPQTAIPTSKLKLLDQVRREIRLRHYSLRTEEAYVDWIKRFIHFHKGKAAPDPPVAGRQVAGGIPETWAQRRSVSSWSICPPTETLPPRRRTKRSTRWCSSIMACCR